MDLSALLPLLLSLSDPAMGNLLKGMFSGFGGAAPDGRANPPSPGGFPPAGDFQSTHPSGAPGAPPPSEPPPDSLMRLLLPLLSRAAKPAESPEPPAPKPAFRALGLTPIARIADPLTVWRLNAYFGARV